MFRPKFTKFVKQNKHRINYQIKCEQVRVVKDGVQLGVLPIDKARRTAFDMGFDLVEIVPHAKPPVCAILKYDKYRYEQSIKEKETRKKNKSQEIKEVRFRPGIQSNDIETKIGNARKFISSGRRVLLTMEYKHREILHKDKGLEVLNDVISKLVDCAIVEVQPKFEGRKLTCRLQPKELKQSG